jgi:hypothetical protein
VICHYLREYDPSRRIIPLQRLERYFRGKILDVFIFDIKLRMHYRHIDPIPMSVLFRVEALHLLFNGFL